MRLRSKSLTGVVQPLSFVDQLLFQQGFRRTDDELSPIYRVVLYDSSTSNSYFLSIPTMVTKASLNLDQITVKIGLPYLESKTAKHEVPKEPIIPLAVIQAAEHKLAEIADYLTLSSTNRLRFK